MNGTTSFDRTNYFQNVPTTALDLALWMESDRMGHFLGVITQELLDEQRGVVKNEKRQSYNQPYGRVWERLFKASFPAGHPYSWMPIGSMADLDAASLDDVKEWFETWYGPDNAVLVLAGDIDVETARERVTRYFGDIPAGPPLTRKNTWIAARTESTRETMYDRVAQPRIYRTWNIANFGTAEEDHLALLAQVLGGSQSSRLNARLLHQEQLVDSISASASGLEISGMFMIVATVKQGVDLARVEAIIDEELARLLQDGPTRAELAQAKTQFRAGFIRGIERVGGFGGKSDVLAGCAVYTGDPGCFRASLERIENATAADLKAAGNRRLAQGDHTLTVLPFPSFTTVPSDVDRSLGMPQVDEFPEVSFPALQRARLQNGIEVVLAERHEIPVVQLQLQFDAGYAADLGGPLGAAAFTMRMLDQGAGKRDALELAAAIEAEGAQLGAGAGPGHGVDLPVGAEGAAGPVARAVRRRRAAAAVRRGRDRAHPPAVAGPHRAGEDPAAIRRVPPAAAAALRRGPRVRDSRSRAAAPRNRSARSAAPTCWPSSVTGCAPTTRRSSWPAPRRSTRSCRCSRSTSVAGKRRRLRCR
jgi:zinc protease